MNESKYPNFIISGFPKCGTSALHYYLNSHPQIFMPSQKELHYFTNPIISKLNKGPGDKETKLIQISNLNQYELCFKSAKDQKAIGDASPSYINYPEVFDDIKKQLKNPKVIIMLRDPVKRAYSNYLHLVREHRESLDFYSALLQENNRMDSQYSDFWYYRFNSLYYNKVIQATEIFNSVLIITQEELNENTKGTIKKVFNYLGVDEDFVPDNVDKRYNTGGVFKDNIITRFIFKPSKFKSLIKKFIPIPVEVKNIKNKIITKYKKPTPPIDEKSERYLINSLKEDVISLEKLGIDVSKWNKKFFD